MAIIVEKDPDRADELRTALGEDTRVIATLEELRHHLASPPQDATHDAAARDADEPEAPADTEAARDAVVVGPTVDRKAVMEFAETMRLARPSLGVVLVRNRIDTAVLTDAIRAGVREVIDGHNLSGLPDAVQRVDDLAAALRHHGGQHDTTDGDRPKGRVVTVFSAKGGCGKTTLASNLAAALAEGGRREVCVVDLDLSFGDIAIVLQLFPAHTIADAVPLADNLDGPAVTALLTPHSPGLTALVAPVEPGIGETIPASLVANLLQVLRQQFDFVIIDTPPAFTDHVLAAFDAADVVALMATLDIPALKNLKLTLETLDLLNYPRERLRIVLNRADSKVGLAIGEVEKTLRVPISLHIPSSRAVPASINRGVPIVLDDPAHPVSAAIRSFAEHQVLPLSRSAGDSSPQNLQGDRRGMFWRKTTRTRVL